LKEISDLPKAGTQRSGAKKSSGPFFLRRKLATSNPFLYRFRDSSAEDFMLKGFKQFVFRGNVVDLAVAVVIGAAFGAVITSFVENVLTPLIAAVVGKPDFSALVVTVNGSAIKYGLFFNALISFLLVAAAIYFFIIAPMNAYMARSRRGEAPPDPTSKKCPECMSDIPTAAKRCAFCTTALQA
jgi:large conductance mechanosensitive channel